MVSSVTARVAGRTARTAAAMPPATYFLISAVFHYLGPSLAVLLFTRLGPMGVAWWRITAAAAIFAVWRRPWRLLARMTSAQRWVLTALGVVLAGMNAAFYLALDRLPMATVGAIEFLGTLVLAALGARTPRNLLALSLAVAGVAALTELRLVASPWGFAFAFANCAGFMLYVVLGHRVARTTMRPDAPDGADTLDMSGIDQLGMAMIVAAAAITPVGVGAALPAFEHPLWLLWAVGVAVCSSVIPYVSDQLAMARLPRSTFALMLALLPAAATVMGLVLLAQVPTWQDLVGIALVVAGLLVHRDVAQERAGGPARRARGARSAAHRRRSWQADTHGGQRDRDAGGPGASPRRAGQGSAGLAGGQPWRRRRYRHR